MNLEQITNLFEELSQAVKDKQIEWTLTANTRYETNWGAQDIVIDRRNNINKIRQKFI